MYNSSLCSGKNMEQDCVLGLYQSVGRAVGEPLSTQDVSQLFGKVFHEPSNAEKVHAAITKISNGDRGWTCAGQNVLHVLSEMEHQRVKSEKLYWERQLFNAVNYHNSPPVTNTPVVCDRYTQHHDKHQDLFKISHERNVPSPNMAVKKNDWSMRRLRKVHRQSWARLVVEGLPSLEPTRLPGPMLQATSQAWGYVTVSDVLLLVEVKYDVVSSLLYTEMLREYYWTCGGKSLEGPAGGGLQPDASPPSGSETLSLISSTLQVGQIVMALICDLTAADVWERMSPWQQREAEEGLSGEADQALESHDLLHLAQLPGAFSMYRVQDQCWSAVSFLCELNARCQQERSALESLAHRMNVDSLKLVCLHVRLATLRAQREKCAYNAVVAGQQSWETWPDVCSPQRAEHATLLLQSEDREHKVEPVSQIPQQALLQLLVLTQEQERRQLILLLQGVSQEEIQGPTCTEDAPKEESSRKAATGLRAGCVRRLQEIYTSLKTQTQSEPRIQDCGLQLLVDLLKLQEVQASVLLAALLDKSPYTLLSFQEDFRSALQLQYLPNLIQLLSSDPPQSCSASTHNRDLPQSTSAEEQSSSAQRHTEAPDTPVQPDVCTGCGAVMAGLPYLEVLGASDTVSRHDPSEGDQEERGKSPEQLQASLITLAWSKPSNLGCLTKREEEEGGAQPNQSKTTCESNVGDQLEYGNTEQVPNGVGVSKSLSEDENRVQVLMARDLLTSSTNSSSSEEHEPSNDVAITMENEDLNTKKLELKAELNADETRESRPQRVCAVESVSAVEREQTMRSLVELQRRVEQRQQRDRERQLLKVQERLSIIQSRKAEEDQLGLRDRLKLLTQDLPQEDIQQQKAVVKERLEQLRRERSYILQSKRDKNTAVFKELLDPARLHHTKIKEDAV